MEDGVIVTWIVIIKVNENSMTCVSIGLKVTDCQTTIQGARCREI